MTWDFGRSVYGSMASAFGAPTASLYELQQRRAALEKMLEEKNDLLKRLTAAGDTDGAKAVRKEYIELTKAREILYGQIKASNKGVLPTSPAAPRLVQTEFPLKTEAQPPVVPGRCYEGRVPNDRYWRGVQTGSDEPFTAGGHTIIRSDACGTGWMVLDPKTLERARQAQSVGPVVRRAQLPPMSARLEERISYWYSLYGETYAPDYIENEGMNEQQAYDAAIYEMDAKKLHQFILENSGDWEEWGATKPQLLAYIDQYLIARGRPEKPRRRAAPVAPAVPVITPEMDEYFTTWETYYLGNYVDDFMDKGLERNDAMVEALRLVNSRVLTEFIVNNEKRKWVYWFKGSEALLEKHIEQWYIEQKMPYKVYGNR